MTAKVVTQENKLLWSLIWSIMLGAGIALAWFGFETVAGATVFPVDSASATIMTNTTTDIVAWGVAIMGITLTIFAFLRIKSLVGG